MNNENTLNSKQSQQLNIGDVSGSFLTHKQVLDKKMSWNDIVKHHLPLSTNEDIDYIFNWCYNKACSECGTSNPKNSVILDNFQKHYL